MKLPHFSVTIVILPYFEVIRNFFAESSFRTIEQKLINNIEI